MAAIAVAGTGALPVGQGIGDDEGEGSAALHQLVKAVEEQVKLAPLPLLGTVSAHEGAVAL